MTEIKAQSKYVRSSPQKLRRIANLIRGKEALRALDTLRFMPQKAAAIFYKVLKSAVANAKNNNKLKEEGLYVAKAYVDSATALKRFRAQARGRAHPRKKRTAHVTVFVSPRQEGK